MPAEITQGLGSLADILAGYDFQANRARTQHAGRLRELSSLGLNRRRSLNQSFADRGTIHSGANLRSQSDLGSMLDNAAASYNQALADRLADIGRKRLQAEVGFNVGSMIPR